MWYAACDKNRPFGAEKSLEPSLILAGEHLNDTSCLNLQTWCQADANLLAGDVLLCCPCSSHTPFSIHLHFYCRCHQLYCSKIDFLADSTGVCVCVKMSPVSLVAAYNYNKRYVGGPREWMKYVLSCSRLWEWLSSLPDSQHPPWPLRHHRWYPGTGQPPVRGKWTIKSLTSCSALGLASSGHI